MNISQRLLFAWTSSWVLAECISPGMSITGKYQAAIIATFAVAYAEDVPHKIWRKIRAWVISVSEINRPL